MSSMGELTIPVEDDIILSPHRMNKIIEISKDIGYAMAEPGVAIGQIGEEFGINSEQITSMEALLPKG